MVDKKSLRSSKRTGGTGASNNSNSSGNLDPRDEQTIEVVQKAEDGDDLMTDAAGHAQSGQSEISNDRSKNELAVINEIKSNYSLLERSVASFDSRFMLRVLRSLNAIRRKLTPQILSKVIQETYPKNHPSLAVLESTLKSLLTKSSSSWRGGMEVDSEAVQAPGQSALILPEIDVYLHLAVQIYLLDNNEIEMGANLSDGVVRKIHAMNRRTLDPLAAKVYFYYARFYELLPAARSSLSIRPQLLLSLRTATLRKDIDTQATIIVLLLRNYLMASNITQADLLVSHTMFPQTAANNLLARYSYYLGKIRAIQLDYSSAHEYLLSATRKAPQSPVAAGFVQAANKLNIVVELLMGEIPERGTFRQPMLEKPLRPYLELARAVRIGELDAFFSTLQNHATTFKRDGTYTLVLRLRQNVIKTGIRMMSLSYSKISLRDICVRLRLDSEESAEYIVAKAIRDGVIEATVNHEMGYMQSKELLDIYATREPQEQFHERIKFCMQLHNESVKAMRFPMNQHRLELKNAQEARERERELAKEIQDGDIDDEDGADFEGM